MISRPTKVNIAERASHEIQSAVTNRLDVKAAVQLSRPELSRQLGYLTSEILAEKNIRLNKNEHQELVNILVNDMIGLGPIEPLLADSTVTDVMVNGPKRVFVERAGKLELTNIQFRDDAHVMNVAIRIANQVGRRIDESRPFVDARLIDGSRVNIIIPPLAIHGPVISIRKFSDFGLTLDHMAKSGNLSPQMASVLEVAVRSRLNILISGGTGSGKTTLLNALSEFVDERERIITIEDAAELQLKNFHVISLETRQSNVEGAGEISCRDLLKNALRMRPDRIFLGEVRGAEVVDMLQAMNTGHEGSLCTIHSNTSREAFTRLENMVAIAGLNLSPTAVRRQIANAVHLVVHVNRMRDGIRRITSITEVTGIEGDIIVTQELFKFLYFGENSDGSIRGEFVFSGEKPVFVDTARCYGLDGVLAEALTEAGELEDGGEFKEPTLPQQATEERSDAA